jgi:hypothetical protein
MLKADALDTNFVPLPGFTPQPIKTHNAESVVTPASFAPDDTVRLMPHLSA